MDIVTNIISEHGHMAGRNMQEFTVYTKQFKCIYVHVLVPLLYMHQFNPLNAELNPICHLLALLGAHPILHISRIRVNVDTTVQYATDKS